MGKTFRSYADSRGIQFLKIIIPVLIISAASAGFPQLKEPALPVIPEVDVTEQSAGSLKAQVTIYGGSAVKGELRADPASSISGPGGRMLPLYSVGKITVKRWSMKREGCNTVFYPDLYELILKNGGPVSVSGNIPFLNRMKISVNGRDRTLYTFYYDYYKNGAWVNSGTAGSSEPSSAPAKGTAWIIELN